MSKLGIPTTGLPVLMANALTVAKPTRKLVKDPGPKAIAKPSIWPNLSPAASRSLSMAGNMQSSRMEVVFKLRERKTFWSLLTANEKILVEVSKDKKYI